MVLDGVLGVGPMRLAQTELYKVKGVQTSKTTFNNRVRAKGPSVICGKQYSKIVQCVHFIWKHWHFQGLRSVFSPKKWWETNKSTMHYWILPLVLVQAPKIILNQEDWLFNFHSLSFQNQWLFSKFSCCF